MSSHGVLETSQFYVMLATSSYSLTVQLMLPLSTAMVTMPTDSNFKG